MITYSQFCPVAKAAEVFGDRWTPIILRELCFGTRGFGDLLGAAPLISRTVLAHKIRHASSYIMNAYTLNYIVDGYQPVTIVTRDGQRIRGVKKNEDAFSVQIMDTHERLQGYVKSDLKEMIDEETSLMPDFASDRLPDAALDDLVAYLQRLK